MAVGVLDYLTSEKGSLFPEGALSNRCVQSGDRTSEEMTRLRQACTARVACVCLAGHVATSLWTQWGHITHDS